MTEPTIRRAGPADAETLSALGARTFSETFAHLYDPQDLEVFLADAYGLERTRADLADPAKASWLVEAERPGDRLCPGRPVQPAPRRGDARLRGAEADLLPEGPPGRRPGQGAVRRGHGLAAGRAARATSGSASGPRTTAPSGSTSATASRRSANTASRSAARSTASSSCAARRRVFPKKCHNWPKVDTISPRCRPVRGSLHCLDLTLRRLGAGAGFWDPSRHSACSFQIGGGGC